jgi:hypothetical protein
VTVTGNVQVQTNGSLAVVTGSVRIGGNVAVGTRAVLNQMANTSLTIDGNLRASRCRIVIAPKIIVSGNVQIQYCTEMNDFTSAEIGVNFACKNSAECGLAFSNVKGNVQINDNSSASVFNNTIDGHLQCQGNTAISGDRNSVGGHKQDQCAGF